MTHLPFRKRRRKINSVLRGGEYFFLLLSLAALGYFGITLLDTAWFQVHTTHVFEQALDQETGGRNHASRARRMDAIKGLKPTAIREGAVVGRLEIPRLGLDTMVLEGSDARTLRLAVGHIPDTALPWQRGNVGIAGHRDTFFRPLRKIRRGDEITLKTLEGSYYYRVLFTRVVDPMDTSVLSPSHAETLTLVSCYPFYFVGSAPRRFVVRAYGVPEAISEANAPSFSGTRVATLVSNYNIKGLIRRGVSMVWAAICETLQKIGLS